jgi:hypothetical protein
MGLCEAVLSALESWRAFFCFEAKKSKTPLKAENRSSEKAARHQAPNPQP